MKFGERLVSLAGQGNLFAGSAALWGAEILFALKQCVRAVQLPKRLSGPISIASAATISNGHMIMLRGKMISICLISRHDLANFSAM
jgi:hypothetical protein